MIFFKLVNIWYSYKQQRGCLMHFACLANTLLNDEESARDNHILACNFAKYLPIKNTAKRRSGPMVPTKNPGHLLARLCQKYRRRSHYEPAILIFMHH